MGYEQHARKKFSVVTKNGKEYGNLDKPCVTSFYLAFSFHFLASSNQAT